MKTLLRLSTVLLAAAFAVRSSPADAATGSGKSGGNGAASAPGAAPSAAPVVPASPNAVPDAPVTPVGPNPLPTPTGTTTGDAPLNALPGAQPGTITGTVPLGDVRAAIENPLVTTQAGASAAAPAGQEAGQTPSQTGLPGGPVPVNVRNLNVVRSADGIILSGTVHTQQDKDDAGTRAAAAANGEQVINNIVVE